MDELDERIKALYAVNGVEPQDGDVCIVDTRTRTLVQGGAIFRRDDGLAMVRQLNEFVGKPFFFDFPTRDCGPYMERGSRVVRAARR